MQVKIDSDLDKLPVFDKVKGISLDSWFPANKETMLLISSLESVKDLVLLLDKFSVKDQNGRETKLLVTPLMSLVDTVLPLVGKLLCGSGRKSDDSLREVSKELNKLKNSSMRKIRNKVGAHQDVSYFSELHSFPEIVLEDVMAAVATCIKSLLIVLNQEKIYMWTHSRPGEEIETITFFGEVATTFKIDSEKKLTDMVGIAMAIDPRYKVLEELGALVKRYNGVASLLRGVPTITVSN